MLGVLAFVVIVLIANLIGWSSVIISKIISIIISDNRNGGYNDQEDGLSEARIRVSPFRHDIIGLRAH